MVATKLFSWLIFFMAAVPCAFSFGEIIAEGKTKIVRSYPEDPTLAIFESKNDITAGNKARHDLIAGKAEVAARTTCNVFRLLADCGLPLAFREQLDPRCFLGELCQMIPYEVVVRREAHGSYLKRYPYLEKGSVFPTLIVEFFLKTSNQNWMGIPIPKDDPFIQFTASGAELFLPHVPMENQQPFMTLSDFPLKDQPLLFEQMALIAKQAFLVLEKAWQLENGRLVDFKVEFGFNAFGELRLADVIDNDSWRVIQNKQYVDKQVYRDGGTVDEVFALYQHVSRMTDRFKLPSQQIILWRGSESDDLAPFVQQLEPFFNHSLKSAQVASPVDKNPAESWLILYEKIREIPDSVAIACLDKDDGIGFSVLANAPIPIIAIPTEWDQFHEEGWPFMTVSEPQNAVLAALQILAARNPLLYMQLRLRDCR